MKGIIDTKEAMFSPDVYIGCDTTSLDSVDVTSSQLPKTGVFNSIANLLLWRWIFSNF